MSTGNGARSSLDDFRWECLAIEVDTSINGRRVAGVLERLADLRGLPASITVDHGPEFEGQVLDIWAYEHRFLTMNRARQIIESWRTEYNTEGPHSSLGDLTPEQFAMNGGGVMYGRP